MVGLSGTAATVLESCWLLSSKAFNMMRERSDISDELHNLSGDVSAMRTVLMTFHSCLRTLSKEKPDEEQYGRIFKAANGVIQGCEKCVQRCSAELERVLPEGEGRRHEQMQSFRMQPQRPDFQHYHQQMQGHKLNLNLCLSMLIV
jgi:hypothetical protein